MIARLANLFIKRIAPSLLANKAERFNTITALSGAALAIFGVLWLVSLAAYQGDLWKISSFSIYGASLILVYVFSTLYHGSNGLTKAIFAKLDHLSIYLLIAGTYTPFSLVTLRDSVGWQVFGTIWAMAFLGITLNLMPKRGKRILPVIIYLVMGWLIVAVLDPLLAALPINGVYSLFIGCLLYTVGIVFYLLDRKVSYFHGIWHLFVLSGSIGHYLTILNFVV